MTAPVREGDTFRLESKPDAKGRRTWNDFRRETDDPSPRFDCERIRVTHVACSSDPKMKPYTFGTEPEWFRQRGLSAA